MKTQSDQADFGATGLFLSGFQSIAEPTYIPLKPLTMLYGPNSAGKSSVIDAIELFENIANRQLSQVWNKVVRWQHRGLDERGRWPEPGNEPYRPNHDSALRVGVEFTVPSDWAVHLDREIKEYKMLLDEQPHLERLDALIGRLVQIDVGIRGPYEPLSMRIAIDHRPICEWRSGEFDDGELTYWDSAFRREGDDGYDRDDNGADFVYGPLRIYHHHNIWRDNPFVRSLIEFSQSNDEPIIASFIKKNETHLDLFGVRCATNGNGHEHSKSNLYEFEIEHVLHAALKKSPPKIWPKKKISSKASPGQRRRSWNEGDLDEFLEEFALLFNALLQIGAASLDRVHVSGSRQILSPADMTFRDNEIKFDIADVGHSQPTPSCVMLARCLAYDETKSKDMRRRFHMAQDHRVVNRWLEAMLPSLRGFKLRADAHVSTPLAKKRESFGAVDDFIYRLYLVDAQGRPHEFDDVGSGFSYLFPILAALWAGTWSIIEQPELHLHPAAQCDLADVFIAAKNLGHAALIESHSENLLLRILRRIRETTEGQIKDKTLQIAPDDVAVLYFDPQADGKTKVKQLRISRGGDFIDRWPAGFFEERSKELFGE